MQFLGIVGTCVLASVVYGVVHDQIIARVCVEYFTVGRPTTTDSGGPNFLGLLTVWAGFGLLLGVPLAVAARIGSRPKRTLGSLRKPILVLLGLITGFALVSGVLGYIVGSMGTVVLVPQVKNDLPAQKWAAFQACWFAHMVSYNVAFVGGGMLIAWVWVSRNRYSPRRAREGT